MHDVIIQTTRVVCTCGYEKRTKTQDEATSLGYEHAKANTPSIVRDRRVKL
jgi:hypothetical protein